MDVTSSNCGVSCASANPGDISIEEYVFRSDPIALSTVPSANGFRVVYHRCCRNAVDNLIDPINQEIYYSATMYSYQGRNLFPCYDAGPQFAEPPVPAICAGYELRYSAISTDPDLDSLSYEFVSALGNLGNQLSYQSGFSFSEPLPGPMIDPTYQSATLDSITGLLEYDSPNGLQGRWVVVMAVDAWRCGQRISRTIRDMTVTAYACSGQNDVPTVSEPVWTQPMGAFNHHVTVTAGDTVRFTLNGQDFDMIGGQPQEMTLSAFGSQFGVYYTNADSGCAIVPCATLSNAIPPVTASGFQLSTTFNWVTGCDHVRLNNECGGGASTYNFAFKYQDNFCPANGINMVNIAVTVLADSIVPSPQPHCVSVDANGNVELTWESAVDPFSPPAFDAYEIFHGTSTTGPFVQVGSESDINMGSFIHSVDSAAAPSLTGPNYYQIRTKSGCDGRALGSAIQTLSSLYLSVVIADSIVELSWNAMAHPPLPSSGSLYHVFREFPEGSWQLIATTADTTFADFIAVSLGGVNYRVELADALPCTSVSNVAGYFFDGISDHGAATLIHIQPNPNTGSFSVSMDDGRMTAYQLLDILGRLLESKTLSFSADRIQIDTNFSEGTYLLRVETERGVAVKKIVVKR